MGVFVLLDCSCITRFYQLTLQHNNPLVWPLGMTTSLQCTCMNNHGQSHSRLLSQMHTVHAFKQESCPLADEGDKRLNCMEAGYKEG